MIPFRKFTLDEKWSDKYKQSIDCDNPKGFSQRAHCQGRKKTNEDVLYEAKKKAPKKKLTGADFERSVVNGRKSVKGSGAQTADIKVTTKGSKKAINAEAKAGNHIDYEQMTISGGVQTDEKGKITKVGLNKPTGKTATRFKNVSGKVTGYVAKHLRRTMKGRTFDKIAMHRGRPVSPLAKMFTGTKKDVKKKITNKHLHALMHHGGDPIHIHHNTTTGEIAVVPVSNKHKKHTNAMGLKGQVSIEQIAHHPKERRSSLGGKMRVRRKEARANVSLQGDSHAIIKAVKRHGGHVFKNHEEFHAHMKKHGVRIDSGHAN